MQKEKMQRIIGIMVIVAFVIVILPLIFGKSDLPLQAQVLPAPPFPDQQNLLAENTAQNDNKVIEITPNEIKTIEPVSDQPVDSNPSLAQPDNKTIENKKISKMEKTQPVIAVVSTPKIKKSLIHQLKSPAWVIQMGSFKNKNNARVLADRLRAAGFKAFIREMNSGKGESTRVYIGPEFKQSAVIHLANKVEKQFKLRGVVMTYLPLEI